METLPGLAPAYTELGTFQSTEEADASRLLAAMLKNTPVPDTEILRHLGLYLDRSALAHILFLNEMYTRILNVDGVVIEMGVRWGRNLAQFTELRNLYEPRNSGRRIIGFDTFAGFPGVRAEDGAAEGVVTGSYSVEAGYEAKLAGLLAAHQQFGFRPHLQKFELVKGNVIDTLPEYLTRHPETVIALAYFDMDLYEGTRNGLELIRDRLVKGSVVVFDELGLPELPGETRALLDTWGLRNLRIQRSQLSDYEAFVVLE